MSFNPDPTKQEVQAVFSRKSIQTDQPKINFNDIEVKTVNNHKHLDLILDTKLVVASHINEKIIKACLLENLIRYLKCTYVLILIF